MELITGWKEAYKKEIEHATLSRLNGNEGMARVCARRAAGIIIGEYLKRCGEPNQTNSAYERLNKFTNLPNLDYKYKLVANHLLLKVDAQHKLPLEADLLSEVIWLEKSLLSDRHD